MIHGLLKLYYEVALTLKHTSNYGNTILYFIITLLMFPVGLNFQTNILYLINIPIICVCMFFIVLLSLDNIFTNEVNRGYLFEYHFLQKNTILYMVLIKMLVRWVIMSFCIHTGIAISIILFNVEYTLMVILLCVFSPTILVLLAIGAIGSSMLVGYRDKGMLLSIIVTPFYIPVLISTINILNTIVQESTIANENIILICILILFVSVTPIICTYTLKMWNE